MYLAMETRLMMLALAVLTSATLFSCKKDDKEGDSNIILEKTWLSPIWEEILMLLSLAKK